MFSSSNSLSEFLLIFTFSCLSQICNLSDMTFSITVKLSNISLIMLVTSLIVLLLRICSNFIVSEVSESLSLSSLDCCCFWHIS